MVYGVENSEQITTELDLVLVATEAWTLPSTTMHTGAIDSELAACYAALEFTEAPAKRKLKKLVSVHG